MTPALYLGFETARLAVNDERLGEIAQALGLGEVPLEWYRLRHASRQVPQSSIGDLHDHLSPLGTVMRTRRFALGMSLRELAQRIGYSQETVGEIEFGRMSVTPEMLE